MTLRRSLPSLVLVLLAGCARPPAAATTSPPDAGWILLFDGTSLRGWRGLGSSEIPERWSVENGAIHKPASGAVATQADGQPIFGADLMTEGSWRDFELEWEWKVAPGANSGIKYNVSEALSALIQPTHAAKGFEYQMLDDDRHPDGKLPTHRAGALYDLVAPNAEKRLAPVGEWNRSRIVLVGNHGEHWLNGARIVSFDLGTPAMDSALTASKYHAWPWFADRRAGHIVIQDHGDEVWVRRIRIRTWDVGGNVEANVERRSDEGGRDDLGGGDDMGLPTGKSDFPRPTSSPHPQLAPARPTSTPTSPER